MQPLPPDDAARGQARFSCLSSLRYAEVSAAVVEAEEDQGREIGPAPDEGTMILKYPNKPVEIYPEDIPEQDDGTSFAQLKLDGFRCLLTKDTKHACAGLPNADRGDGHLFLSRRGLSKGGPTPLPVSDEIVEKILALNLPDNSMFDAEWVERRTAGPEGLYIHDVLWLRDEWMGNRPCLDRFEIVNGIIPASFIPMTTMDGFADFFEASKQLPQAEGLVIKDKSSIIKASREECKKNALWLKVKWRAGFDGKKIVA